MQIGLFHQFPELGETVSVTRRILRCGNNAFCSCSCQGVACWVNIEHFLLTPCASVGWDLSEVVGNCRVENVSSFLLCVSLPVFRSFVSQFICLAMTLVVDFFFFCSPPWHLLLKEAWSVVLRRRRQCAQWNNRIPNSMSKVTVISHFHN